MTRSFTTRLSMIGTAGIAVFALALTGCARASHAGAAATVGNTRISAIDLQAVIDRGLKDPTAQQQLGAQKEDFQRQVLTRLIQAVLVDKLAKREGVTVTQQQIDAKRADYAKQSGGDPQLVTQAAQNGVAEPDLNAYIRTIVLRDAVGKKLLKNATVPDAQLKALYQQNIAQYDTVHAAHILVSGSDKALADSIKAQLDADPTKFAALAKQYSTDTSNKDKGGDLGPAGKGQFVKEFENAIFTGKVGTIVGPVKTQFGYHIIHIIDHKKISFEQAKGDLTTQALSQQITDALDKALADEAAKDKVSVSPRYGKWDATQSQVVASPSSLSSPGASPSAAPAATSSTDGTGQVAPTPTTSP